jgi:hypothetical protein
LNWNSQVGAELPVDSDDADIENKDDNGSTLLCVFERGYLTLSVSIPHPRSPQIQGVIC